VLGTPFELGSVTSKAIFRMCQEAITNSLKHSNSDEIHIVLRYNENDLEIYIMDNGQGCEKIVFGKGLMGMKRRIIKNGGQIDFTSGEDCGFRIHAIVKRSIDDLSNDIT
jgi:signal transduction histidine kinase